MSYPSWSIILQLKHVHSVVDPSAIVVKLNITCQSLQPDLHTEGDRNTKIVSVMEQQLMHLMGLLQEEHQCSSFEAHRLRLPLQMVGLYMNSLRFLNTWLTARWILSAEVFTPLNFVLFYLIPDPKFIVFYWALYSDNPVQIIHTSEVESK